MTYIPVRPQRLFETAGKMMEAYHAALFPLCKETGIPPLAMDILLFIANNPDFSTAGDICRLRGVKPGIVSVHIERMVTAGLLGREKVPGDRRKSRLRVMPAAAPLVERGQAVQKAFGERLLSGLDENGMAAMRAALRTIEGNIDGILKSDV